MPFDKRIITKQGQFNTIAIEIMNDIPKKNPSSPFRVPTSVVMENPAVYPLKYFNAHLYASGGRDPFFPGDVPVAPPDLLRGEVKEES